MELMYVIFIIIEKSLLVNCIIRFYIWDAVQLNINSLIFCNQDVVNLLCDHPDIKAVSFVGSDVVIFKLINTQSCFFTCTLEIFLSLFGTSKVRKRITRYSFSFSDFFTQLHLFWFVLKTFSDIISDFVVVQAVLASYKDINIFFFH